MSVDGRASRNELTLAQIVDRCTEALGGSAAIEKVHSIQIAMNIKEAAFDLDGIYVADRKLRMRIDVSSGQRRVYTEAYDGEKAWQMGSDGQAKDSSPEGTAALRHGILFPGKLFGFHEQESIGNHLELAGREAVDGVDGAASRAAWVA